ncbi:cellulose biosynthesis protein BcsR [Stenotrophomonas maltophilia]|nr:cellulose biosynthesis protein BcsR [Stenotrophomonas maltophilia]
MEEDDIDLLRRSLDMPAFPYVDFSAEHERAQALARWPLLAELELRR